MLAPCCNPASARHHGHTAPHRQLAAEEDRSHPLSSLTDGTTYTCEAYAESGYATTDELAEATFTTP